MQLYRSSRCAARLLALGSLVSLSPLHADSEEFSAQVRLSSSAVAAGAQSTLRLRSPLVNHPAILLFGSNPVGIPLGGTLPVLRSGGTYVAIEAASTGATGLLEIPFGFPASTPAGLALYGQAFVVTTDARVLDSNLLPLRPNGTPATWTDATSQLPPESGDQVGQDADFADLDKDGDLDLVTVGAGENARPLVFINDGTGNYSDESLTRLPSAAWIPAGVVEIGDVNGDGWDDLFLGGAYDTIVPAPNLLLFNDGTGNFLLDGSFPQGAGRPLDAEWADVDGDEDLDLVVINLEESEHNEAVFGAEIYVNSAGVFAIGQQFSSVPGSDPHTGGGGASLADFDADGDLDLFIARSQASSGWQNELWLNDGSGVFSDSTQDSIPAIEDNSHETSILDADGDGRLDIFVFNSIASVPGANHLLLNQGGSPPVFVSGNANVPANLGNTTGVRFSGDVADVDQDGDPDVLVGIHAFPSGGKAVLLLNQGGVQQGLEGTFLVDPSFSFDPAVIDGDPSFEDVDGDGDFDLYLGSAGDIFEIEPPQDHLYINAL